MKVGNVCQQWINLIKNHEQSLYESINNLEQQELEKHKSMDDELQNELKLLQQTKEKCRRLIPIKSVEDIFDATEFQEHSQIEDSKDDIPSIVDECISHLNKSLVVPDGNAFTKSKFNDFDAEKAQVK